MDVCVDGKNALGTFLLLISTGRTSIDVRLPQVLALFELVFRQRIRAYYLTGSSIDGTAVTIPGDALNSSDIGLAVVFKDTFQAYEKDGFKQCRAACEALGSFHLDQFENHCLASYARYEASV